MTSRLYLDHKRYAQFLGHFGLMQEKEHFERADRCAVLADTRCRERGLDGVKRRGVGPNPRKYPGVGECQFLVQSALGNLPIQFKNKGEANYHYNQWPTRRSNSNSHRRPGKDQTLRCCVPIHCEPRALTQPESHARRPTSCRSNFHSWGGRTA